MMRFERFRFFAILSAALVAMTLVSVDFAEARKGGSFGTRGMRTQQAVPPTRTAPNTTAPVDRSMSPTQNTNARQQTPNQPAAAQQQRPGGLFGGLGGGLMRGLMIGGLFGMLMGYGFGGMAGMLGFLVQLLLVGVVIWVAMAFFRSRRQQPAMAGNAPRGAAAPQRPDFDQPMQRDATSERSASGFTMPKIGGGAAAPAAAAAAPVAAAQTMTDIQLDQGDLDAFERILGDVQRAFADEDFAALRRLSTPEMVSYFSEEMAENAKNGVRNDVSGVHLLQADIAEAWNEGAEDYATAAFNYEAIDVLRDRNTGALASGSEQPEEIIELWTFVRKNGGEWKLSAIQEASA